MPFVPFTILNLAVFRLSEKFPRTDRQTDRQTDKPTYRSSSPELKKKSLVSQWKTKKGVYKDNKKLVHSENLAKLNLI